MYEGIIKRHKDQLDSETEESSFMDKTGDISKLTEVKGLKLVLLAFYNM